MPYVNSYPANRDLFDLEGMSVRRVVNSAPVNKMISMSQLRAELTYGN